MSKIQFPLLYLVELIMDEAKAWLRGGVRPGNGGIPEVDVQEFVMYGGYGALAGAGVGCAIRRYYNLNGIEAPAIVLGLTGVGHMIGHEYARREMEKQV